jgi:hypothetical protein
VAKTRLSGVPSGPEAATFELKIGATLSNVRLTEPIEAGKKLSVWRGQREGGGSVTVHALMPGASKRERDTFFKAADRITQARGEQHLPGVVPIAEIVPSAGAYIAELAASGTLADLPVLDWEFTRKFGFVRRLALIVATMHKRGLFHGCMRPQNILLDEQFEPVVSDVGALVIEDSFPGTAETRHEYWAYTAREVRQGQAPNARSDIFSLGRLLHFVLAGDEPNELDENLPKLDRLADEAPGLVRIVRRATLRDAAQRYESVDQFLDELGRYQDAATVGIAHPDGLEGKERKRDSLLPGTLPEARPSGRGESMRGAEVKKAEPKKAEPAKPDAAKKTEPGKKPEADKVRVVPMQVVHSTASSEAADPISGVVAVVLGSLGLALLAVAGVLAYRSGEVTRAVQSVGIAGAVFGSAWLPGFGRWYLLRPGWVAACVALVVLGEPWELAASAGRKAKFSHGTPAQRAGAVVALARGGRTQFRELDLTGADFAGQSLPGVDFSGTKLTGARFERADVARVNFADADIGHADFKGAKLDGAQVSGSVGWREAVCDDKTVMPAGWSCAGSNPRSDHDVKGLH